jgi:hypothetical protein
MLGEGEWKVKVHGKGRPRKWIKLHLAIDAKTQEIVTELTTASSVGDPTPFPALFRQIAQAKEVIADGERTIVVLLGVSLNNGEGKL